MRTASVREARQNLSARLDEVKKREGALTRDIVRRVQQAMVERLDSGTHHRIELTRDVHRRAEHFLLTPDAVPLRAAARAVGLALYPS
jgi:hypothetical protein